MNALKFSNASFVLYQILSKHRKIDFLYDTFFGNDAETVSHTYFKQHIKSLVSPDIDSDMAIVAFITSDGDQVNVIMDSETIHINCDRLKPIRYLVTSAFMDGNILIRDKSARKTPKNREQFHMRFYRAYKKINPPFTFYPIVLS